MCRWRCVGRVEGFGDLIGKDLKPHGSYKVQDLDL